MEIATTRIFAPKYSQEVLSLADPVLGGMDCGGMPDHREVVERNVGPALEFGFVRRVPQLRNLVG